MLCFCRTPAFRPVLFLASGILFLHCASVFRIAVMSFVMAHFCAILSAGFSLPVNFCLSVVFPISFSFYLSIGFFLSFSFYLRIGFPLPVSFFPATGFPLSVTIPLPGSFPYISYLPASTILPLIPQAFGAAVPHAARLPIPSFMASPALAGAQLLADLIPFYLVKFFREILFPGTPPSGYPAYAALTVLSVVIIFSVCTVLTIISTRRVLPGNNLPSFRMGFPTHLPIISCPPGFLPASLQAALSVFLSAFSPIYMAVSILAPCPLRLHPPGFSFLSLRLFLIPAHYPAVPQVFQEDCQERRQALPRNPNQGKQPQEEKENRNPGPPCEDARLNHVPRLEHPAEESPRIHEVWRDDINITVILVVHLLPLFLFCGPQAEYACLSQYLHGSTSLRRLPLPRCPGHICLYQLPGTSPSVNVY